MSEFDDYQLDPLEEHSTIDLAEELVEVPKRRRGPWLYLGLLLLAILAGWAYWRYSGKPPEAAVPAVERPELPAQPLETAPEEEVDLPVLAESDAWLRDVIGQLSEHPRLATWLVNEDLARRFVAAVVNIADGSSPRSHVRFLQPGGGFRVEETGDRAIAAPATYHRYDTIAAIIGSLHVDGTAKVYRNIRPLLDEAYRDLGYPDGDFDAVATKAAQRLLDTPVLHEVELVEHASSYKYADPRLEGLSEAEKHFLRLGPDNLSEIQAQVRRIATLAGLPVE